ncbi:hypothetical protein DRB17_05395 [Ferruginivarius sediminum]|uniref:Uncharacterized protein n=1 Tax=Ferruginivarius sediminum TaxID=2661937 RepID=A0A369TD36_9PROT|nr:hypothetical protein DRB17_05395 [Ferruginivarius sediminum]
MGRLDLIAVSLTVLGVTLALMAFGSFFVVRSAAMYAAQEEARDRITNILPDLISPQVLAKALEKNPHLLQSAVRSAMHNMVFDPTISEQDALDIAESFNGEE